MISRDLARALHDAGLAWKPQDGDRFVIPDRDLEDQTFSVSEMSIQVDETAGGREIFFNGAVEWALDSIEQGEVIWLPTESQLREELGPAFESLHAGPDGFVCRVMVDGGGSSGFSARSAADAYGLALLAVIERG